MRSLDAKASEGDGAGIGARSPEATRSLASPTTLLLFWIGLLSLAHREALGFEGSYAFAEIGVRFNYARLSFYARVREEEIQETAVELRRARRFWVGLQRTFGFAVGERSP